MEQSAIGLRPGSVIQDTYRVTKLLGEGGMGATFAGENMATGHAVAIKVITPEFARNGRAADLFRREANLLRTVQSEAVVRYETTLMDQSGQLYLVMEYIQGRPLSHYLERGARLASTDVLKLAKRLLGGLAAIHKLGIVHRDISPDNIIIPDDDILGAKLIDFGVASDTVGTDKSSIGDTFAGKISYASPEQLGLGDGKVVAASDLYSLGLVLMRVAGRMVPGAGQGLAQAIDARRSDLQVRGDKISPALSQVLEALLKANPDQRPSDPVGMVVKALAAPDTPAKPEPDRTAAPKPFRETDTGDQPKADAKTGKSSVPIIAAVVLLAALGGGAAWYFLQGPGATPGGVAMEQAEIAKTATEAPDPLSQVTELIDTGTEDNLNAAFGALMKIARDDAADGALRGRASMMIAQMYDPETFDPQRSPFPGANPRAAVRFYKEARDHGAEGAEAALARLGE